MGGFGAKWVADGGTHEGICEGVVASGGGLQGTRVLVRIVETSRFHIVGEVVDRHPAPLEGFLSPEEIAEKVAEEMRKSGRGDEEGGEKME